MRCPVPCSACEPQRSEMTLLSALRQIERIASVSETGPRLICFDLRHLRAKILRARCSVRFRSYGDTLDLLARWPPILIPTLASVSSCAVDS